jgi:hypothetical protein
MLEQADLAGEWRLRHVQAFGRSPEVQLLADGDEARNSSAEHDPTPVSISQFVLIVNQSADNKA